MQFGYLGTVSHRRSSCTRAWWRAVPNIILLADHSLCAPGEEFHRMYSSNLDDPHTGHCIHIVCAVRIVWSPMLPCSVLVDQPSALCLPHASSAWCENTHECMPTWARSPLVIRSPAMLVCMMVVGKMLAAEYWTSDCLLECLQGLCRTAA